jgi:hypothetical protein
MPRLYAFVVCEKVILDESGTASLISLFDTITGGVPQGVTIPPNAIAPKEWVIFVAWQWTDADAGKTYTQSIEMLYPDNTPFGVKNSTTFVIQPGKRHQFRVQSNGFPIGQIGTYTIRMWLEHNGVEVVPRHIVHINVQHAIQTAAQSIESKAQ